MKKFITLALALVLALSLAAPALAFTSDEYAPTTGLPFEISIRLIDVGETAFGISFLEPAANRGYARGEVVCAIADLTVPKGKSFSAQRVGTVEFVGDNVNLYVTDNMDSAGLPSLYADADVRTAFGTTAISDLYSWYNPKSDGIYLQATALNKLSDNAAAKDRTYSWAFFAKVTGDNAFMRFGVGRSVDVNLQPGVVHKITGDYSVFKYNPSTQSASWTALDFTGVDKIKTGATPLAAVAAVTTDSKTVYVVMKDNQTPLFAVVCNATTGRTEELWVYLQHGNNDSWSAISSTIYTPFRVYPAGSSSIYFQGPAYSTTLPADYPPSYTGIGLYGNNGSDIEKGYYNKLLALYNTHFASYFGLDIVHVGNVLNDSFWNDLGNADDYYVEVAIEPWYSYVEVPPEIVVDPPKTGDAMNVLGFVMIALAGLAVVAVKKVRA